MMWTALLIALVLSLAALAFVVWPLFKRGPAPVMVDDDRLTELLGRKDAVMMAIKELEFDYHVGKLSEEDYQLYDQRLRRQAVGLLQQIEQLTPMTAQMDAALEAEIARRRRVGEPAPVAALAAPSARQPAASAVAVVGAAGRTAAASTAAPATAPINGNGARPRFCTNCGNAVDAGHKFCANCGAPISA
jgi:hypothetical protein